jgi:NTP pyrophosphatase (non-canonical NTP hydrolase)
VLPAGVAANPEPVADELADLPYGPRLLAQDLGIDLEEPFERKMPQNERKHPVESSRGRAEISDEL